MGGTDNCRVAHRMILSKDNAEDGLRLLARGNPNGKGRLVSRHCTAKKIKTQQTTRENPLRGLPSRF